MQCNHCVNNFNLTLQGQRLDIDNNVEKSTLVVRCAKFLKIIKIRSHFFIPYENNHKLKIITICNRCMYVKTAVNE